MTRASQLATTCPDGVIPGANSMIATATATPGPSVESCAAHTSWSWRRSSDGCCNDPVDGGIDNPVMPVLWDPLDVVGFSAFIHPCMPVQGQQLCHDGKTAELALLGAHRDSMAYSLKSGRCHPPR